MPPFPINFWKSVSQAATSWAAWGWGRNALGQIGDNTAVAKSSPVQVGTLTTWTTLSSRSTHNFTIDTANKLWAWGSNNNGQLGVSTTVSRSSPVQVGTLTNWSAASTGAVLSFAIDTSGQIWSWGGGVTGGQGQNDTTNRSSPVQIGTLTNWSKIASGFRNGFAIDTSNQLWSWGLNTNGELAQNTATTTSSPVQVGTLTNWSNVYPSPYAAAGAHAITTTGALYGWGLGTNGRLGDNTATTKSSPVQIGTLTNWSRVSDGPQSNAATKTDGTLWTWGANNSLTSNQIGDGTLVNKSSPVQIGTLTNWSQASVGGSHMVAVKTDGTLWGWGNGNQGQLGPDAALPSLSSPVQIGTLATWAQIATAYWSAMAVRTDGTLWGWGRNDSGQLAQNDTIFRSSPIQVGTLTNWSQVATGFSTASAVKTDGTMWSWGVGPSGQLGNNTAGTQSSPVQVGTLATWGTVTSSSNTVSAIKTDNTLWGWGLGGVIGDNTATNRSSPVQIGTLANWSRGAGAYTGNFVSIKTDNTLWAWGNNGSGQLGLGDIVARSSPVQVGTLATWSIATVTTRSGQAVKTDGTLWAWGANASGQLGDNTATNRSSPVQIGTLTNWALPLINAITAFAVKTDNTLWSWGSPATFGVTGQNNATVLSSPVQVGTLANWSSVLGSFGEQRGNQAAIINTTAHAIKTDGTLWSWGNRGVGIMGDNNVTVQLSPVQIGALTTWHSVEGGADNTAGLKT